eukprot:m.37492 g.37492  ORF g.37492 m.37492 type:complete len:224 (+) comp9827_c0_seq1:42-713(+)
MALFSGFYQRIVCSLPATGLVQRVSRWQGQRFCFTQCWSCEKAATLGDKFFCGGCGTIQPHCPKQTHFEALGCPQSFSLSTGELDKHYRTLQRRLHPDKFSMRTEQERQYSAVQSSQVNRAYNVLKNPLARGQYMLQLRGVDTEHVDLPPAFLMEVMELNEELESARGPAITQLQADMAGRVRECEAAAAEAFEKDNLLDAQTILAKMKYFVNLEQQARDLMA